MKGHAHSATGWVLQREPTVMLCGVCALDFARWYRARQQSMGHSRRGETETFQEAMITVDNMVTNC